MLEEEQVRQAFLAGCSCQEVHLIKRAELRNRLDHLQTALGALNLRDASFSRRGSLPTIR